MSGESPLGGRRQPLWRQLLPFALAFALVGFVLSRLDLRKFVAELARVDYPAFLAFTAVFVVALVSADTFGTVVVYRRTLGRVGFVDFWLLRGASYLPSLLNHHVGQAFIVYFLSRVHRVALPRVAGATLLVYASWTGCLLLLGSLALWVRGDPVGWLAVVLGVGVLYLVVIAVRPAALARWRVLAPLFEAGVGGHLVALLARMPHVLVLFLGTWLPFFFFGVRIPFKAAAQGIPILMVIVTLPLTPQGFGTRDVAAGQLFGAFADPAAIAAATASWGVALTLVDACLGLFLMRRAMSRLSEATAAPR